MKMPKNDDGHQMSFAEIEQQKRLRVLSPSAFSPGSHKDESGLSIYETSSSGTNSPSIDERLISQRLPYFQHHPYPLALQHYHQMINSQFMNLMMPHMTNQHSNLLRIATTPMNNEEKQIDVMTDDTNSNDGSDDNENEEETSPKSKSNFSISAILGLEKGDLKATPTTTATACH
jgi:hypothetical protein